MRKISLPWRRCCIRLALLGFSLLGVEEYSYSSAFLQVLPGSALSCLELCRWVRGVFLCSLRANLPAWGKGFMRVALQSFPQRLQGCSDLGTGLEVLKEMLFSKRFGPTGMHEAGESLHLK